MTVSNVNGPRAVTSPLRPVGSTPLASVRAAVPAAHAAPTAAQQGERHLTDALSAFFGSMTAPARALAGILTGGMTPIQRGDLVVAGIDLATLKNLATAFAPMLLGFGPVGQIMGAGALSWLVSARSLDDLVKPPAHPAAGRAVAEQAAGAIFPAAADGSLREAATQLLTTGQLDARLGDRLGPAGLRRLAETLHLHRDLLVALAGPSHQPALDAMLAHLPHAVHDSPGNPAGFNAEVKKGLPTGVRLGVEAAASADARGSVVAEALGARLEAQGAVSAQGRAWADAEGTLAISDHRVAARGALGVGAHLEAHATGVVGVELAGGALAERTEFKGDASAEAEAVAQARAIAGFDEQGNLELDLGFDAHAAAAVAAKAKLRQSINLFGFTLGVEGYAGAQAGAEAGVTGWLTYKNGELHLGGGLSAALGVGADAGAGIVVGVPPFIRDAVSGVAKVFQSAGEGLTSLFGSGKRAPRTPEPVITPWLGTADLLPEWIRKV